MKIITIASQKGGAGKTTIATHLAVLAQSKGAKVLIIDLDPQKSASKWHQRRKQQNPWLFDGIEKESLPTALEAAYSEKIDFCIIDTQPSISVTPKMAIKLSDICLIPCRPHILDLDAVGATIDIANEVRAKPHVVLNSCTPGRGEIESSMTKEAREALLIYRTSVSPISITQRVILSIALIDGSAVTEIDPICKASQEMHNLWKYVKKKLAA